MYNLSKRKKFIFITLFYITTFHKILSMKSCNKINLQSPLLNSQVKPLEDITTSWISENITNYINLYLDKIHSNYLSENTKELIFNKLINKYKFVLFQLFKKRKLLLEHKSAITNLVFSPSGKFALSGSEDSSVILWNLSDVNKIQFKILKIHDKPIISLAISPCGRFALTASKDNTACLLDLSDLENIKSITLNGHKNPIYSVAFSSCGNFVLTASKEPILRIWDLNNLNNFREIQIQDTTNLSTNTIKISPSGKFFLVASTKVFLYDLTDVNPREPKNILTGHKNLIVSLGFSNCEKFFFTGSLDHTIRVWDISRPDKITSTILEGHTEGVISATFSPCSKYLLSGSLDRTIRMWDLSNLPKIESVTLAEYNYSVSSLTFSPNANYILIGRSPNPIIELFYTQLTLEQLIFIAVLIENKKKQQSFQDILNQYLFKDIFKTFTNQEQKKIKNYFS